MKSLLFFAYLGLIGWLSLASHPPEPDIDLPFKDKFEHAAAYAVMVWLFAWAFFANAEGRARGLRWGMAFAVLCGGLLEVLQWALTAGRAAEWGDLLADFIGALIAWGAGMFWVRRLNRG